jgi:hypothetical protein
MLYIETERRWTNPLQKKQSGENKHTYKRLRRINGAYLNSVLEKV